MVYQKTIHCYIFMIYKFDPLCLDLECNIYVSRVVSCRFVHKLISSIMCVLSKSCSMFVMKSFYIFDGAILEESYMYIDLLCNYCNRLEINYIHTSDICYPELLKARIKNDAYNLLSLNFTFLISIYLLTLLPLYMQCKFLFHMFNIYVRLL